MKTIKVDIADLAKVVNRAIVLFFVGFVVAGVVLSSSWFAYAAVFGVLLAINVYFMFVQKEHAILRNYGLLGYMRYALESFGPELRQYLYASDTEERPFSRVERAEVYRKAKNLDASSSFGSLNEFDHNEIKLRHSLFPVHKEDMKPYSLTFGEERKIAKAYTIQKPFLISAMSYGALGEHAVRALSRGAKKAKIAMNTGEGGFPKYHLKEGADLVFQMGTAKFGVRNHDGSLNEKKLKEIASNPHIKMIEIKLSQGAKPGKGGLLPKEKITDEIAELRGVPMGADVVSPPSHVECTDYATTVGFIKKVQDVSELPVGIKFCFGSEEEVETLIAEMKKQQTFPDYMVVDGAQGGTGAAPKSFMDDVGVPVYPALRLVHSMLLKHRIRDKMKLLASGKLINPGKQLIALSLGADAIYTARGFMLALGCIQALQCNANTCPAGITTHRKSLQRGLDIEQKSERVKNYVSNLDHDFKELLSAMGCTCVSDLRKRNGLYVPEGQELSACVH